MNNLKIFDIKKKELETYETHKKAGVLRAPALVKRCHFPSLYGLL